jgi:hypothetical protein
MAYADRKHTSSKLELARRNSKWANHSRSDGKIDQRKKDLWDGIHQYIGERGGAITSVRHVWPIRLEVDPESELPAKLAELGYDPIFCEQATRIGPPLSSRAGWKTNSNAAYSFHTRDVYELCLPK